MGGDAPLLQGTAPYALAHSTRPVRDTPRTHYEPSIYRLGGSRAGRNTAGAQCYNRGMTLESAQHVPAPVRAAAEAFLRRLEGIYDVERTILFGSRARGDNRPDSDLDLAVVLRGARGDFIDTKLAMAGIAFDVMLETGILVQAFPMWGDDLAHPERSINPTLIRNIAAEGIGIETGVTDATG